jgi:hypothetical protein
VLHLETYDRLEQIRGALAAGGPDHHVVEALSRLALEEFALARKRWSLDVRRARSSGSSYGAVWRAG